MPDAVELHTADGCTLQGDEEIPADPCAVAVCTHPHPLYGGDRHNIVPSAMLRALPVAGIGAVRFDFRGTGGSTGEHDGGEAEALDVVSAIDHADAHACPVVGVGYSFGADVLLTVDDPRLVAVVVIAPPLRLRPLPDLRAPRGEARPTLVLSPAHDQFRPAADAAEVVGDWPSTTVEPVAGADHFLAGRVDHVVDRTTAWLLERLGG